MDTPIDQLSDIVYLSNFKEKPKEISKDNKGSYKNGNLEMNGERKTSTSNRNSEDLTKSKIKSTKSLSENMEDFIYLQNRFSARGKFTSQQLARINNRRLKIQKKLDQRAQILSLERKMAREVQKSHRREIISFEKKFFKKRYIQKCKFLVGRDPRSFLKIFSCQEFFKSTKDQQKVDNNAKILQAWRGLITSSELKNSQMRYHLENVERLLKIMKSTQLFINVSAKKS